MGFVSWLGFCALEKEIKEKLESREKRERKVFVCLFVWLGGWVAWFVVWVVDLFGLFLSCFVYVWLGLICFGLVWFVEFVLLVGGNF